MRSAVHHRQIDLAVSVPVSGSDGEGMLTDRKCDRWIGRGGKKSAVPDAEEDGYLTGGKKDREIVSGISIQVRSEECDRCSLNDPLLMRLKSAVSIPLDDGDRSGNNVGDGDVVIGIVIQCEIGDCNRCGAASRKSGSLSWTGTAWAADKRRNGIITQIGNGQVIIWGAAEAA